MAVYTPLEFSQIADLITPLDIGTLQSCAGISGGIENSNFLVTTELGKQNRRWVLTLFEYMSAAELEPYMALCSQLAESGLPVPSPARDQAGHVLQHFSGRQNEARIDKAVAVVPFVDGAHPKHVNPAQCRAIGNFLGQLHKTVVGGKAAAIPNPRGADWLAQVSEQLSGRMSAEEANEFQHLLGLHHSLPSLPQGLIHADLFRDNCLFQGDSLCAVIDWYFACHGCLLFDLAVCINDWCFNEQGQFLDDAYQYITEAYLQTRPLQAGEADAWPIVLQLACGRFWASRLRAAYLQESGPLKPASEYLLRRRWHRDRAPALLG